MSPGTKNTANVVLGLTALVLAGCGTPDLTDLQNYAAQVKMRRPPPISPLPEYAIVEGFRYDAVQRRDPFIMDRETAAIVPVPPDIGGMAPDSNRPRENLERFSLDSLLMQGILQQDGAIWGLVLAKEDKTLHRVAVGNYLGQHHGRIIRIAEQRIDLIELIQDSAGHWLEREASLALAQDGKRQK
jgi:type IV pilus assembly protein PilP